MNKKTFDRVKYILSIIINTPFASLIISINIISGFLSVTGIPLLVFSYQYFKETDKNLIPHHAKLENFFNLLRIDLNIYSLVGLTLFIILIGQACLGGCEMINRFMQIKFAKEYNINLIKSFKETNWLKIIEDRSGQFQHAIAYESYNGSQVILDSLRLASTSITVLLYIFASLYLNLNITILFLFFFIFLGLITLITSNKISFLSKLFNDERIKTAGFVANINNNKKFLKTSVFPNFFETIYKQIKFAFSTEWHLNVYVFFVRYTLFILAIIFLFFLILFYEKISAPIEQVAIISLIFLRITPMFIKLSESYGKLCENIPILLNLTKRLKEFQKAKEKNGKHSYVENSLIKFDNVSFKYPGKSNFVIKNLNLIFEPKKVTAIIGDSGSGKSTTIDLLIGLIRPCSGRIKYGLIDQKKINIETFRKKVSYISQSISLFDGTIKDNLTMGTNNTHQEIISACKISGIYTFIQSLPKKFETNIGENAIKISGGQKQRILIARSILSKAEIIILDEAINQLDAKSIALIKNAIIKIKKDKTIIIISHQNDLKNCYDKIYYL